MMKTDRHIVMESEIIGGLFTPEHKPSCPTELILNISTQVWSRVSWHALRPHHIVPAAGERGGGRHLSGGEDDQYHETGRLH